MRRWSSSLFIFLATATFIFVSTAALGVAGCATSGHSPVRQDAVRQETTGATSQRDPSRLSRASFEALMQRLADGWNRNDAREAIDCFTNDARYSAPPNPRIRRGRDELFRFFGGETGRPHAMHLQWHHLIFDEAGQIGAGEYTFKYEIQSHGVVLVRLVNGRIAQWREWEVESPASFEELTKDNAF
ncbi:MAG TPA: nuclear transport factor 2 family protein [Polyangiaceae bacterium]|nr:nuclear transport factor 2 family protein [Polyangiaceae bacterium]